VCVLARVCSVAGVQLEIEKEKKKEYNNKRWVDGGERAEHNNRKSWGGLENKEGVFGEWKTDGPSAAIFKQSYRETQEQEGTFEHTLFFPFSFYRTRAPSQNNTVPT
jgi:hypothetical protein